MTKHLVTCSLLLWICALVGCPTTSTPGETDNDPPVADAGPDQTVNGATLVTLDGSGSNDPDDDALTFVWTQNSGINVVLSDADTANPTFIASNMAATLAFALQVIDDNGGTDLDAVTITVVPVDNVVVYDLQGEGQCCRRPSHRAFSSSVHRWERRGSTFCR